MLLSRRRTSIGTFPGQKRLDGGGAVPAPVSRLIVGLPAEIPVPLGIEPG